MFEQNFNTGKILSRKIEQSTEKGPFQEKSKVEVQCVPLYSLLLALNRTTVDYFSLDVEGNELEVLQSIPWDKVNIKVM